LLHADGTFDPVHVDCGLSGIGGKDKDWGRVHGGGIMVKRKSEGKPGEKPNAVIVGGPTASGKSAAAIAIAQAFDGVVINADSMQLYRELDVLTARPSRADEAVVPHKLYGVWSAASHGTVGRWRTAALAEIEAANKAGKLAIVCGGTGMYLKSLVEGLSHVPEIPPEIRIAARRRMDMIGAPAFFAVLKKRDPAAGARLGSTDRQRMLRAWEVLEATGRTLADFQAEDPPSRDVWPSLVLLPPRDVQRQTVVARALRMIEAGAVTEVRNLLALGLSDDLPAMRALGVREIAGFLRGDYDLDHGINLMAAATQRFAKRQATWFRGQMKHATFLTAQYSESLMPEIRTFIKQIG
jgi:tRNA dimethylallyltransferase